MPTSQHVHSNTTPLPSISNRFPYQSDPITPCIGHFTSTNRSHFTIEQNMSSLVLFAIGSLLVSRSAQGIPVPAPPAPSSDAAVTAAVLAPSATIASATISSSGVATTSVTGSTTSLSSSLQAASTATTSVSEEEGPDLATAEEPSGDGPLPSTATSAASSTGISALNGMSTKQLAIYCGIGK